MSASPAPMTVTSELRAVLRRLKLGQMLDTLPERLALARHNHLPHADFLELVLTDEIARRDRTSAMVRARAAHLDPTMVLEGWDDTAAVTFDRTMWAELTTLRFVDDNANALILGPVGVGKTFLAAALGHIACRRRYTVHFERADKLFKRLKAAYLDASHDVEMRKLLRVDVLIIDDLALQSLDPVETADLYELVVERHRQASLIVTSNRDPSEWMVQMADPLLAQSAIDRIQSAAFELVVEGESYRKRQKPVVGAPHDDSRPPRRPRRRTNTPR